MWVCDQCERDFITKEFLDRHRMDQSCQNKLKSVPSLDISSILSYIPQENPLKCGQCNRIYACKQNLDRHKALCQAIRDKKKELTSREEIFKCDPCNKVYKRKHSLNNHRRKRSCLLYQAPTDKNGQPVQPHPKFKCDDCGASYSVHSNIQKHKDEGFCQQRQIKLQETLNSRSRIAKTINFNICETCGKVYKRKSTLLRHQEEHLLGDSNLLSEGKVQIATLQDAVQNAIAQNKKDLKVQFPCRWCYATLYSQSAMVTHMKELHHKDIPIGKLACTDAETNKIDFNRLKGKCCYVCLKKFHCVYMCYICLEFCEDNIGLSLIGYQHPNRR